MKKVIRDGKVAILYSPGYGAGWSTWNKNVPECIFSPEIVKLVEEGRKLEITDELCENLFNVPCFSVSGAEELEIKWIQQGEMFFITVYDGLEEVEILDKKYNIA